MSTLNSIEEIKLSEKLIELHPWAEMARFTRFRRSKFCGDKNC